MAKDVLTFSIEYNFNDSKVKQEILKNSSRAQKVLDSMVLKDSNYYCPQDTSALQKSGITNTVIGSGLVRWKTSYAREQYYGANINHSHSRNPNATFKWFETAKAKRLNQWIEVVKKEMNKK